MLKMKAIRLFKIITLFFLLFLFICIASLQAQQRERPGSRNRAVEMHRGQLENKQEEQYFEKLCDHLQLEKKQRKAAGKLFKKMQKKTEKIAEETRKGKIPQYEASERRIKMQKDFRDKFKALLDEEQQIKYEKLRETGLKTKE
jgi:hypothetical protein